MDESKLLERITVNPEIFAGKAIIRGRRLAVEHVLGMLAAGDTAQDILKAYPWLEPEDVKPASFTLAASPPTNALNRSRLRSVLEGSAGRVHQPPSKK